MIPNRPWEIISMDLITQLPESNSYNAICVIIDRLIKRAHFISINNWFSSKNMALMGIKRFDHKTKVKARSER